MVDLADLYRYLRSRGGDGMDSYQRFDGIGRVVIARRAARMRAPARAERLPFLDEVTGLTTIDPSRLARFRADLRPGIVERLPAALPAADFLTQAHLLRDGQLTRTGALLFGAAPTAVFANAIVQCRQIHGVNKSDLAEDRAPLDGSVAEQIVQARDFVARLARRGDRPTADSAVAQTYYTFPMVTVREVIANALVHRDYEQSDSCVHVRFYADRIEVVSPGRWHGVDLETHGRRPLGALAAESKKRNFRLASILTWIRVVEGEGSGIPRALEECRQLGAEEPTVTFADDIVTVTIHPVDPPTTADLDIALDPPIRIQPRAGGSRPRTEEDHPVFFMSYARSPRSGQSAALMELNPHVTAFYDDLSADVNDLLGTGPGKEPGFIDESVLGGERWTRKVLRAVNSCQVFLPLISSAYFTNEWASAEWNAFARREVRPRAGGEVSSSAAIIPIVWIPMPESQLPEVADVPHFVPPRLSAEAREMYLREGLYGLRRIGAHNAYDEIVWRLAQHIVQTLQELDVAPGRLRSLSSPDQDETTK
ncbi:TIR-like protein FxsC [Actinoplanes sp. NPDC026619]|uniref:TIR-like protein FxsC n=1 Tax=Actinoplanes sp. NPDC026619 TaxID=3155798 RepID=UPI0033DA1B50